jgi:hypothetical protein
MGDIGVFSSKKFMDSQGIILGVNGQMSQAILVEIGGTLKQSLLDDGAETTVGRKVFSIFIEQMQNIIRYSADRPERVANTVGESSLGIVLVGQKHDVYYVKCGNLIKKGEEASLRSHFIKIRSLDKKGLKEFYKQVRKEGPPASSKGAGLGLIDMARQSSRPLEYAIDKVDEELSFFSTCVFI